MIRPENLDIISERLKVYDVVQEGWEHEPKGIEVNFQHVLTHLAKDPGLKDFSDPELIRNTIAPDSLQYALRLGRWAGIHSVELSMTETEISIPTSLQKHLGNLPPGVPSYMGATSILAKHLHDIDHKSTQFEAEQGRYDAMRSAARLLLNSAEVQAGHYNFNLVRAFDNRLRNLRERFGIPEPE